MEELIGRRMMKKELPAAAARAVDQALGSPAMYEVDQARVGCHRCDTISLKEQVRLKNHRFFCPACIQLGRVESQEVLYHVPEPPPIPRNVLLAWAGQLSEAQKEVSLRMREAALRKRNTLVWAVTGAGKTEMIFQALLVELQQGYRVCIASPRVDVCLELYPRIKAAFPEEAVALLHGGATEEYRYTKLVICTTHQLLRFYQAFDLLIIDEVDAFPYAGELLLHTGVRNALKQKASLIYLTATPTKSLRRLIQRKELQLLLLPARYHRRLLPVPKLRWSAKWRESVNAGRLPKGLFKLVTRLMVQNDVLLFCPTIAVLQHVHLLFAQALPCTSMAAVHSRDQRREEKVRGMRSKRFRLFLTSTILERGVTFDQVSVIVLGAEHRVFTESALVQIAGRVDRRPTTTHGEVWFVHSGRSRAMKRSIAQIQEMNRSARNKGLIDEMPAL